VLGAWLYIELIRSSVLVFGAAGGALVAELPKRASRGLEDGDATGCGDVTVKPSNILPLLLCDCGTIVKLSNKPPVWLLAAAGAVEVSSLARKSNEDVVVLPAVGVAVVVALLPVPNKSNRPGALEEVAEAAEVDVADVEAVVELGEEAATGVYEGAEDCEALVY